MQLEVMHKGQNMPVPALWRYKSLILLENHQITGSIGGRAKLCTIFHLREGNVPVPPCRYVPGWGSSTPKFCHPAKVKTNVVNIAILLNS